MANQHPDQTSSAAPQIASSTKTTTTLPRLGHIILTAYTSWNLHLRTLPPQTFQTLTTKPAALIHILSTLPARHKALALSYNTEIFDLSDTCAALLEGLQNEEAQMDLTGFYDHKLFKGKKFRQDVIEMDEEVRKLEEARLEELKGMMSMYEDLVILREEGVFGEMDLELLIEAMDDVGLSASSAVSEG